MKDNYVYSLDGEIFYPLDIFVGILESEYEPGKYKVEKGIPKKLEHSDFISGGRIIESIQENCWDENGEYAEDYLDGITDADKTELENVIADWLEGKVGEIKFFGVEDVEESEVEI